MSRHEFESFLKRHAEEEVTEKERVDWNKRKNEWVKNITAFHQMVIGWLKDYAQQGKVIITAVPTTVNEEPIGTYRTQALVLKIANREVRLSPVGTLLIGARGRIDMESGPGRVTLVLVDEKSKGPLARARVFADKPSKSKEIDDTEISWTWKIATPPPSIRYIPLNEESFFDALMELINV
jgi:hypothetical protein